MTFLFVGSQCQFHPVWATIPLYQYWSISICSIWGVNMKHNDQVNAGPPLVGNHGLAPPAASSGDGRAVESSSPTRSWANVVGSPGRGEGSPGGGRGVRQDPGPAAESWYHLGGEAVPEGQGNTTNRSWAEVVASPARGQGQGWRGGPGHHRDQGAGHPSHHTTAVFITTILW